MRKKIAPLYPYHFHGAIPVGEYNDQKKGNRMKAILIFDPECARCNGR